MIDLSLFGFSTNFFFCCCWFVMKIELMLLGFISLLLVVLQTPVSQICIPRNIAATWHPCSNHQEIAKYGKDYIDDGRKILEDFDSKDFYSPRRNLVTKGYDKCAEKASLIFTY